MSYMILIAIVLSNLLSVSYAIGNPVVTHFTFPFTAAESNESFLLFEQINIERDSFHAEWNYKIMTVN